MAKTTGTFVGTGEWDDAAKTFTITGTPGPAGPAGPPGPQGPPGTSTSPPVSPPVSPPQPGGGFKLGDVPFKANSLWNTPVPSGAKFTALAWPAPHLWQTSPPRATNYVAAWDSYSPAVYIAAPSDAIVKVTHPATWGRPAGTENIHMPDAAVGAPGTDQELVVIDGTTVHSFWIFDRKAGASTASCSGWGKCDVLTDDGFGWPGTGVGAGTTAIGASMFGGLIVEAETKLGAIKHCIGLRMGVPLVKQGIVPPAINSDSGMTTGIAQEADLLAIPPTVAMPSGLSALGQIVFAALQKYGAYVNDRTNDDQWGGTNGPRVQANAYDNSTCDALNGDLIKLIPLLRKVT